MRKSFGLSEDAKLKRIVYKDKFDFVLKVSSYLHKNIKVDKSKAYSLLEGLDYFEYVKPIESIDSVSPSDRTFLFLYLNGVGVTGDYLLFEVKRVFEDLPTILVIDVEDTANVYGSLSTYSHFKAQKDLHFSVFSLRSLMVVGYFDKIIFENLRGLGFIREGDSGEEILKIKNIRPLPVRSVVKGGIFRAFMLPKRVMKVTLVKLLAELSFKSIYSDFCEELLYLQQRDYNLNSVSSQAKVFEDKKFIPKALVDAASKSNFLKSGFTYLEYDEDVDLVKVAPVERKWVSIFPLLPKAKTEKLELRFKKLGKHKAEGIYFPNILCLCVDIRNTSSFLHEYGHHIDYFYTGDGINLSLRDDFYDIRVGYVTYLHSNSGTLSEKDLSYLSSPTEIFARCFELYYKSLYERDTTLLTYSNEKYAGLVQYRYLLDNMEQVSNYMESVFGVPAQMSSSTKSLEEEATEILSKVSLVGLYGGTLYIENVGSDLEVVYEYGKTLLRFKTGKGYYKMNEINPSHVSDIMSNIKVLGDSLSSLDYDSISITATKDKIVLNSIG